jgi:ATP-dependent Clp protease adapter protein ClpS
MANTAKIKADKNEQVIIRNDCTWKNTTMMEVIENVLKTVLRAVSRSNFFSGG